MKYEELNGLLGERFPFLESSIQEVVEYNDWIDSVGSHVLYGDVLNRYVTELLRENKEKDTIKQIFEFYEELAESEDREVRNLLKVTLLEYLWDEKIVYDRMKQYMLPATREINKTIGVYLREPRK